jgi:hypothetical protein
MVRDTQGRTRPFSRDDIGIINALAQGLFIRPGKGFCDKA